MNGNTQLAGVVWHSHRNRWEARGIERGSASLYYGVDFFEACCARKSAETRL